MVPSPRPALRDTPLPLERERGTGRGKVPQPFSLCQMHEAIGKRVTVTGSGSGPGSHCGELALFKSGAKSPIDFHQSTARLKPCPDKRLQVRLSPKTELSPFSIQNSSFVLPSPQKPSEHQQLPEVIGVVVGDKHGLAQYGLAVAVGNPGKQVGRGVFNQPLHGL